MPTIGYKHVVLPLPHETEEDGRSRAMRALAMDVKTLEAKTRTAGHPWHGKTIRWGPVRHNTTVRPDGRREVTVERAYDIIA